MDLEMTATLAERIEAARVRARLLQAGDGRRVEALGWAADARSALTRAERSLVRAEVALETEYEAGPDAPIRGGWSIQRG